MWEEQPEYQKAQAKMMGVGVVLAFLAGVVFCVSRREWHLLRQVLLMGGAFAFCMGLLSGTAWLLVRIFARRRSHKGTDNSGTREGPPSVR